MNYSKMILSNFRLVKPDTLKMLYTPYKEVSGDSSFGNTVKSMT